MIGQAGILSKKKKQNNYVGTIKKNLDSDHLEKITKILENISGCELFGPMREVWSKMYWGNRTAFMSKKETHTNQ